MILENEIMMFPIFSEEASDLLKNLLQHDPFQRLGYGPDGV